jgi:hypothetical protein
MKKLQLTLILLFSTLTTQAQYLPNFSTMSFYNQNSGLSDLHFNDDWTRDTNSIILSNSVIRIPIANGTTHYVQTGLLNLKKDDIISFDHRISNSSGSGTLTVSYIDNSNNEQVIKTLTYNSANNSNMTDTVKILSDVSRRFRFTFTKSGGNNQVRFEISSFSVFNPIVLSYNPTIKSYKNTADVIEDEVSIYNMFGVCVYQGYLSEFYKIGNKGEMYFTNKTKFIIQ